MAAGWPAHYRGVEKQRMMSYGQNGYGFMALGRTLVSIKKRGPIAGFKTKRAMISPMFKKKVVSSVKTKCLYPGACANSMTEDPQISSLEKFCIISYNYM